MLHAVIMPERIRYPLGIDTEPTNPEPADLPQEELVEAAAPAPEPNEQPAIDPTDFPALLVALLFTSGELVEADRLTTFLGIEGKQLASIATEASDQLYPFGLDIMAAAGGYKLVSASRLDEPIGAFHREVRKSRLSKSALEVLAIVAYDQPVSRVHIDEVRQVNSESTVRALLDRRLITVAGRQDTAGRPFLYKTTDHFLEVFGLETLKDLPPRPTSLAAGEGNADLGPFVADEEVEVERPPVQLELEEAAPEEVTPSG
jgi:segregation and condensation protein B